MILKKIAYLILMIISVFFYILFIGDISFYIMVFVFAFPVAMLAVLIAGRICITVKAEEVAVRAVRGEEFKVCFRIRNKCILPFPQSVMTVCCTNRLSGEVNRFKVSLPVGYLSEQKLMVTVACDNCGILDVKAESLRLYDYIRLFSMKMKSLSAAHITVTPNVFESEGVEEKMKVSEDSEVFSKVKSGDDPSEIFELKDYIEGDRLNRIHWNLSSVRNTLITKHYSQGVSSPAAIVPDIALNTDIQTINAACDIFFSIACAYLSLRGETEIVLPTAAETIRVTDHDDLVKVFEMMVKSEGRYEGFDDLVKKAIVNNSAVYFVTNTPFEKFAVYDESIGTAQRYFFVENSGGMKISGSENIRIVRASADMAAEAFIKGL